MKKKGISLLLATLLLLALVGCASTGTNGSASAGTSVSASAAASGSAETPIDLSGHSLSIYCGAGMVQVITDTTSIVKNASG